MRTVTMCGSMRFTKQMKEIALDLECAHNFNVLQCIYNDDEVPLTQEEIHKLVLAHYKKIDLCDSIYVVDIDAYIGESVKNEILYAKELGKHIIYHTAFQRT